MESKNTKSMNRIGLIVILGSFFICFGLMESVIYAARPSKPLLIPGMAFGRVTVRAKLFCGLYASGEQISD